MGKRGIIDETQKDPDELFVSIPESGSCNADATALRSLAGQLEKHKHRKFSRIRLDRDTRRIVFVLKPEEES